MKGVSTVKLNLAQRRERAKRLQDVCISYEGAHLLTEEDWLEIDKKLEKLIAKAVQKKKGLGGLTTEEIQDVAEDVLKDDLADKK